MKISIINGLYERAGGTEVCLRHSYLIKAALSDTDLSKIYLEYDSFFICPARMPQYIT